jgi:hypothetical protein
VRVSGVPVTVRPRDAGMAALVEVRGPLAFEGTSAPDKIPWKTSRAVDAVSGMVHLPADTEGLVARANVHGRFIDIEAPLGDARVRWLTVPCDALTLDTVARPELEAAPEESAEPWAPAKRVVHLRAGPGAGALTELDVGDDLDAVDLRRLESAGPWMRVSSHILDGSTLQGWVKREELRRPSTRQKQQLEGPFVAPSGCERKLEARAGSRVARATVADGTQVYAARYLGPWATVRAGAGLTVRLSAKDDWVELVGVPGIVSAGECPEHSVVLDDAWVPRASVTLARDPETR